MHGQQAGFEGLVDDFLQFVGVFLNGSAWSVLKKVTARSIYGQYPDRAAFDHGVEVAKLWHDTKALQATRAGIDAAR